MNEPSTPLTFDPNRKSHAFARRFLISASCVAAVTVCALIPASVQGQGRGAAPRRIVEQPGEQASPAVRAAKPEVVKAQPTAPASAVVSEAAQPAPKLAAPTGPDFSPAHMNEVVSVMVEMKDAPAATIYAESMKSAAAQAGLTSVASMAKAQREAATSAAVSLAKAQVSKIESAHLAILPKLNSMAATGNVIFRTKSAYNGISLYVKRSQIAELNAMPGVKAVHVQIPKFQTAATDIDFLGGRTSWVRTNSNNPFGIHGENIKVAIIDSGLDYIHTNFGGPGTPAAYASVTDVGPVPNAYFPSFKVPGGYDFAGDAYTGSNTPVPDTNPFDSSNGHGTACASLIGGLGVAGNGSTFVGVYNNATDIASMRISPGFAPKSFLYPLRVFGTSGSTNLVTQAINYAVDPNGDGNVADHYDVISMSLGANGGDPSDPDDIAATNAAAAGVLVCSAAGNAGDSYFIVSSPSVASNTLSVAASFNDTGGYFFNSNVTANSPAAIAGQKYSSIRGAGTTAASALIPPGGLTGNIVYANPPDASTPLTNAAAISGNICLIDRGAVSFVAKAQAAQAAGATGVIIVQSAGGSGTPNPITMALDATVIVPDVMIGLNEGNAIKAQLDPVTRTGVNVTINNDNGFFSASSTAADTMPSYSARGPRAQDAMLKPDISAPAEVVGVAVSLTGTQVGGFNGTSSATPHIAGIMALLRQYHPTWTVEELMALVMNTSTHNLFTGPGGSGNQYGTGRVGAGRVDVTNAMNANVVAYNGTDRGLVNVSFGIVEVPVDSSTTLSKNITVSNKGLVDVTYNVTYADATPLPGATFTVGSAPTLTVTAGSTASLPVTFTATGNLLKHARELSAPQQLPAGSSRQWLSEKTGYAVLTPTGGTEPTLRVALYSSPKPVSAMRTSPTVVIPGAATGTFTLSLTGAPVNTGTTFVNANPQDIIGLAKPFELQYASPLAGTPNQPTDANVIKYVGVTSDYVARGAAITGTVVTFALEGFGPAAVPSFQSSDKEIFFSTDGGTTFTYAVFLSSAANGTAQSNAYFPTVVNLGTGAGLQRFRTNGINPGTRDTNAYGNNVVTIPILATDIGLIGTGAGPTQLTYEVITYDRNGTQVNDTGLLTYDLAKPGLDGQGGNLDPFFYNDISTTTIPVNYNGTNYQTNGSLGLMIAHMHNATGAHSEIVTFGAPTISSFSPTSGKVGSQVRINGTNFGPGTKVTFFNNKPATPVTVISSTTILVNVPVGATTGTIRVSNAAGVASTATKFTVLP